MYKKLTLSQREVLYKWRKNVKNLRPMTVQVKERNFLHSSSGFKSLSPYL